MKENTKNYLKKYFSLVPKNTLILVLLIMTLLITIHGMKKTLVVSIDGKEKEIITYKKDLKNALERSGIVLGPKDKIDRSIDSAVKNGDKIYIKKAVTVALNADGEERKIITTEKNIEDLLLTEGIALGESDKVMPSLNEEIKDGMEIAITRVNEQLIKETYPIDFSTEVRKDNDLEKGKSQIVQEGVPGEREISIKVIYEDGKEIAREVISDIITKHPIDKVLLQGNMNVLSFSRGGESPVSYSKVMRMKATAYDPASSGSRKRHGQGNTEYTATGTIAKRNPGGYSTIAVDPRVIPLGTKVYVEGYGLAIAEDTGGDIRGSRIDVYFNTYSESMNWGVKHINVYIVQ